MSLFQQSVLIKYQKSLDNIAIDKAYNKFTKYFHNEVIQKNIRNSKEEQYQEGFLRELFVNILDYKLNPSPDFNLTTEYKNEKGSKKADGAILKNGNALAVIELKSTKTKNLESIRQQAFDYKSSHSNCVYVITSNFEKIRFYIDNAVDYEEFNLFTLSKDEFYALYICLHCSSLIGKIPSKIKKDSLAKEEEITNDFYIDYSNFKRELYRDLVKRNSKNTIFKEQLKSSDDEVSSKSVKLNLFKKSQKLIDRFLFIFFSEDRGLLPPNSTLEIILDWDKLVELDAKIPLYDRFKMFFNYLDTGRTGTDSKEEIFAYNGGLFKPDNVLDSLVIGDELLYEHAKKLSNYNFESQVGVNILGHIFENSLNEIESVNAEILGSKFDKQKTKRKKDGVFYTPKYITNYIVDNTLSKYCDDKRLEMNIIEDDYRKSIKGRKKKTLIDLKSNLDFYREWLLNLTICDPACGSGAFLNQALNFLINENKYIDELEASLFGEGLIFRNIENTILENNIFGVDINEESIEITKLSLWLRTAQPRRKLNNLSNNIKCGNSLVNSKTVAGDFSFSWENEFPDVFKNGGFDIVIGNPPYVNIVNIEDKEYRDYLKKTYSTFKNKCDLYSMFIEKSISICNNHGELGFIFPNSWMGTSSFSEFRKHIAKEITINGLVELPPGVFEEATVTTVIMTATKQQANKSHEIKLYQPIDSEIKEKSNTLSLEEVLASSHYAFSFDKKIHLKSDGKKLDDIASFSLGIKTSNDKRFVFDRKEYDECLPMLRGKNIKRNSINYAGEYLWYMPDLIKEKAGGRPRVLENYLRPKILIQDIAKSINAAYDDSNYLVNDTINVIYDTGSSYSMHYVIALLNSKAVNKWFSSTFPEGLHIKINQLQEIPLPKANSEKQKYISELSKDIQEKSSEVGKLECSFVKYLQADLKLESISKKVNSWHYLDFHEFIKALRVSLKKEGHKALSKSNEIEWMVFFEERQDALSLIKNEIIQLKHKIDQKFYEMYDLSKNDIKYIEATCT